MNKFRTQLLYAAYILTIVFFFLFYLFPADIVKDYILFTLHQAQPELNFTTDKILPAFPVGVKFKAVKFYYRRALLLNAEQINLAPRLWSLFNPPADFAFKARAYGGTVKGRGTLTAKQTKGNIVISAQLAGIQLKDISALRKLSGRNITGVFDANVTYDPSSRSNSNLDAELVLSDCNIELIAPVFNLKNVAFKKIEAVVALSDHALQLKQCVFNGEQMNGTLSGSIILNSPLKESVIRLSGNVTPQPALLANLDKVFPVNKNKLGTDGFPVTLGGTLDKPNFSLK